MDRVDIIREYARKEARGIEIGPYFAPLVPKAQGWNVLSLDVVDAPTLRNRAAGDPNIPRDAISRIEDVDLLGPADHLKDLVDARQELGKIDFIVSSHNFEHIPNPIGFLTACSEVLRPGGVLSMAIPDKRTCFDYFRPVTTLAAMLEAHVENRERPTAAQLFEMNSLHSRYHTPAGDTIVFSLTDDPIQVVAMQTVEEANAAWKARIARGPDDGTYEDCHCWIFTPASLRLLLLDLRFLGYIELEPIKFYDTSGNEFYIHLRNTHDTPASNLSRSDYYEERQTLLHTVNRESAANAAGMPSLSDHEVLRQQISRLEYESAALRQSTSWRITAPLRLLAAKLRVRRTQ